MGQNDDLLGRLREEKERRHLTYQDIVDQTELNGEAVSMTTVRRVFAKDAHLENFRYKQTVVPIVRVLLDSRNDPIETELNGDAPAEEIERMRSEICELRHDRETKEQTQLEVQTKLDDYLGNIIQERDAAYRWYKAAICVIGVLVVISILLDLAIGSVGLIRY